MSRAQNGQGTYVGFTMRFDPTIPEERDAFYIAQHLAGYERGRRKDLIVAMFQYVAKHERETGEILTPTELTNRLNKPQTQVVYQREPAFEPATPAIKTFEAKTSKLDNEAIGDALASAFGGMFS